MDYRIHHQVQNDSFYVKPFTVHYTLMGPDTIYYGINSFALTDIFVMPRKGELFNYTNDHVTMIFGNEHWIWIKNGWFFMVPGSIYAGLNITNSLLKKQSPFTGNNITRLGVAAAVIFVGGLLHLTYHSVLKLGKKYYLKFIKLSEQQV